MTHAFFKGRSKYLRIVYALAVSSLAAAALIIIGALAAHSSYYIFLLYNLGLAYVPLLIACLLIYRLRKKSWLSIWNIILTLLWLGFLPNSFYLITDLIHAQSSIGVDLLYNIVMLMICIFNGMIAGYLSLYLIHQQMLKRMNYKYAHLFVAIVLLLCSFAIYLGRYLRWNSWDVIFNPAGILFDVTDTIASPSTHPQVFTTTLTFFLLLGSTYLVIWQIDKAIRRTD